MKTSMVDFTCLTYKLLHNVEEYPEGSLALIIVTSRARSKAQRHS